MRRCRDSLGSMEEVDQAGQHQHREEPPEVQLNRDAEGMKALPGVSSDSEKARQSTEQGLGRLQGSNGGPEKLLVGMQLGRKRGSGS